MSESVLAEIVRIHRAATEDGPSLGAVFAFELEDTDPRAWTVDLATSGGALAPGAPPRADCTIRIRSRDLQRLLEAPSGETIQEVAGNVQMEGDVSLAARLLGMILDTSRSAAGSMFAKEYEEVAARITDRRFTFMNWGYAERDDGADLTWVRAEDAIFARQLNLVRHVVDGVEIADRKVLDVGSGRGGTCFFLARYGGVREAWGLDYCAPAVERSREINDLENVHFVQGDALALSFEDASFDVVTNIESSHCYPGRLSFFQGVRRVLVPGGHFCFTDGPIHAPSVEALLLKAGFEIVRSTDISAQVLRALLANREGYAQLLRGFVAAGTADADAAERLIRTTTVEIPQQFQERGHHYHSWLARKPLA